jgi:hypothetical protein
MRRDIGLNGNSNAGNGIKNENLIPKMGFASQKSIRLGGNADLGLCYQSENFNGQGAYDGGGCDQMLRQSMDGKFGGIVLGRKNDIGDFIESDADGESPLDLDFSKRRNRITTQGLESPDVAPKMGLFRQEMGGIERGLSERSVGSVKRSSGDKKHKTLSSKDNPFDSPAKSNFSGDWDSRPDVSTD